jgi:hypothetical protein
MRVIEGGELDLGACLVQKDNAIWFPINLETVLPIGARFLRSNYKIWR